MSQLTSLLTAAALLVHLLAGCCWHHAHESPIAEVTTSPACCHHKGSDHASHESSDAPQHETCEEGRCVTILSVIAAVSAPWDLPSLPCPDGYAAPITVSLISTCAVPFGLAEPLRPPLTPVAMHQLLRI